MINRESAIYFQNQHGRLYGLGIPLSVLLLSAFIGLFIFSQVTIWYWVSVEVHSSIEVIGGMIAIIPAMMILAVRNRYSRSGLSIPVICGLSGMGVFSIGHALVPPGDLFVWLHSVAILLGGACFFSGLFPQAGINHSHKRLYFTLVVAVVINLAFILLPDAVPTMLIDQRFSNTATTLNVLGGVLFLITVVSFLWQFISERDGTYLLLASVAFTLGMSGVLFPFSNIWSDVWWYWHALSLAGFALTAFLFLSIERHNFLRFQRNTAMLAAISNNANASIYVKDDEARYRFVNSYWEETFGLSSTSVIGHTDEELFPASMARALSQREHYVASNRQAIEFEETLSAPDGRRVFISAKFPLLTEDDTLIGLAGIYTDIGDRKALEEQLEQLAHFDNLTNLPNRALARDRLSQAIAQANRKGGRLAVLFLDIDNFKMVNDSLGHIAGDDLLLSMTNRLGNTLRGGDTLSRLGGDEFLVILLEVATRADALAAAEKLLATTHESFEVLGTSIHSSLSIGLALYPEDGKSIDELIQHADTAMYQAKSAGRGRVVSYEKQHTDEVTTELRLLSELRKAIDNHQFELYWQPQVNLADGSLSGAEALLRWTHPTSGLVLPQFFIPFAESHGLIAQIDAWVLGAALEQIGIWSKRNSKATFSINLAPADVSDEEMVPRVLELCEKHAVKPRQVVFEITEQDVVSSLELGRKNIEKLKACGFLLSIDDFGTGNSSFLRLKKFPFTELKIDQRFIRGLPEDTESKAIVEATISMAKALDLQVMVEGIETQKQAGFLLGLGCTKAQGYHFDRPAPAHEFERNWL